MKLLNLLSHSIANRNRNSLFEKKQCQNTYHVPFQEFFLDVLIASHSLAELVELDDTILRVSKCHTVDGLHQLKVSPLFIAESSHVAKLRDKLDRLRDSSPSLPGIGVGHQQRLFEIFDDNVVALLVILCDSGLSAFPLKVIKKDFLKET